MHEADFSSYYYTNFFVVVGATVIAGVLAEEFVGSEGKSIVQQN